MPRPPLRRARTRALRLALLTAAALPAPGWAQGLADDTIVVTARRQEESFADVPLAVKVVAAEAIGAGGVDALQALASKVPGLTFEAIWGGVNSFPVLRGQKQGTVAGDNVGMFVDGVYQANRDALDVEPLDLERIEVVLGPQSALFGHSSFAGLIHYVPARPTEQLYFTATADLATNNLYGMSAALSGPLGPLFKARLAASWKSSQGTWTNAAAPGQHLGNSRRLALSASIATREGSGPLSVRLSGRYGDNRSNLPPTSSIDYRHFNCGSRDALSGAWSYFCGDAPVASQVSLSPDLPDSTSRTGQAALHMALDLGGAELSSLTSFQAAKATSFRDLDASAEGELFGVCNITFNCTPPSNIGFPVIRLQRANTVNRRTTSTREWSQELRLRSTGKRRFEWQLGAIAYWTRSHSTLAFSAQRGALSASEQLTSYLGANPQRVGPVARFNQVLADDPNAAQTVQNDFVDTARSLALFASASYRLAARWRLRGEVRFNWERVAVDSRLSNFATGFGTSLGPRQFHDITPRFSLDYRPGQGWLLFASYARGSRSGGINATLGLLPEEQTFEPETNWTAEVGVKFAGKGLVRSLQVTAYDIDWHNTQIIGFGVSPGVSTLITRNTKGVHTRGIEVAAVLAPARWLEVDFAWSHADPRFKAGSEDPGSGPSCGLSASSQTSSFCTIRPSTTNPAQLVPDISGNQVLRAPRTTWAGGVNLVLRGNRLRLGVSHQDKQYERAVNGLYYGARTLIDARLTVPLGALTLDLWGTNLADRRYIRAVSGRPPLFYTGIPRPNDLIHGDGRRIGLTFRYVQ